jgi:hypothetical protein
MQAEYNILMAFLPGRPGKNAMRISLGINAHITKRASTPASAESSPAKPDQ